MLTRENMKGLWLHSDTTATLTVRERTQKQRLKET